MLNSNFCHLHVHSAYSQLDGLGSPSQYAKRAKELGFKYLAVTDHGNVDALIQWQRACDEHNIQPILGTEAYIVPNALIKKKNEKRYHIVLLIKNEDGYHDLLKLLTYANLKGHYYRPRIDVESLLNCNLSNFVIMSACVGSFVHMDEEDGHPLWQQLWYQMGKEDFYLEIMPHDIEVQYQHHEFLKDIHEAEDIPYVISNDCHYILEEDWKAQEVLLAIQKKAKWNDPDRFKFGFEDLHLRTANEMLEAFEKHDFTNVEIRQAMRNTIKIAKQCCDFRIPKQTISLPVPRGYNINEENTAYDVLEELVENAKLQLLADKKINEFQYDDYNNRIKFELNVIKEKDFALYFLIVHELIGWCKQNNIMIGPGRGSAAGSLISYLLKITSVDPIEYGLLFERFIDLERPDYPDIDIDVEDSKRELVREHLEEMYGKNNVASISTFDRMKSRGAVRDVARVFNIPYPEVDEFAKAIIPYKTPDDISPIKYAINNTEEGKKFNRKYKDIVDLAIKLEGTVRNSSRHAAAIVVSNDNLTDGSRCNLCMRSGQVVVNWDMNDCEYSGLMKLDILGLKTLSVLNECKQLVEKNTEKSLIFEEIPLNDDRIFKELSKGNTIGVFQVSARPTTELAMKLKINSFADMISLVALVRPGAMDSGITDSYIERKHGRPQGLIWEKKHNIYEKITKDTYSLIVFQEQIMKVISEVAGLPVAIANKIRKIIGKKRDPKEFAKYWDMFLEGCLSKGTMDEAEAETFWEELQAHANYSFNKSHSVCYALIGYWTAYLKINYPTEFICALLTYGSKDDIESYIQEAHRMKLGLIPPKVGISDSYKWVAKNNSLYVPFIEIKGIGNSTAKELSGEKTKKKKKGAFFSPDEIGSPLVKPGSKIDAILKQVGAYQKKDYPKDAQELFDFSLSCDNKIRYTNLYNIMHFNNDEIDDILNGEKILFKEFVKRKRFKSTEPLECRKCELREECTEPVLSSIGIYNIAIIAEAPGRSEDLEGIGLCGRSGKDVLWPELELHGLKRRQFHVSNICHCFPSQSKTPTQKHIDACLPFLLEELKEIECRIILALGKTPLMAFTGRTSGITNLSGKIEWIEKLGAWVFWCIHPASVLYNRNNKDMFERGIKNFAEKINFIS